MSRRTRTTSGLPLFAAGVLLVLVAFGGAWATAPDRTVAQVDASGPPGTGGNASVLVGVQGPGPRGSVVALDANGSERWSYGSGTGGAAISYQSVEMLDDHRVLAAFADDGYRDCGPYDPPCKRTGVRIVDAAADPTVVYQWSYPVRTRKDSEVHDAELLPSGDVLVADMEYESIFVVDLATGERNWTWNASEFYDPPPDPTRVDWLHINDVDRIGEGRYLVSVRNENQLVVVERGAGVVEVVNEDGDPAVMNEQHNPQWLGDGRVLVADSENHRVVELHRDPTTGEWRVAWIVRRAGGLALDWPRDADRLPNGNTVITDSGNDRVVVVDGNGTLVRSYATPPLPYEADVLPHGEQVAPGGSPATDRVSPTGDGPTGGDTYVDPVVPARVPVLSTLLAAARHVVPVPYWVSELHLVVLAVALALWGLGVRRLLRNRRAS